MNYENREVKRTKIEIPTNLEIDYVEMTLTAIFDNPHWAEVTAELMKNPPDRGLTTMKYAEVIGIDGDWAVYVRECD